MGILPMSLPSTPVHRVTRPALILPPNASLCNFRGSCATEIPKLNAGRLELEARLPAILGHRIPRDRLPQQITCPLKF
jgi:hypothetical protein